MKINYIIKLRGYTMNKKGQAAMEFLATYGWALLVIVVAISALATFGVLNADKFLPERCIMPSGIACLSHKATTDSVQVVLQNSLGQTMLVTNLVVGDCSAYTSATSIANGGKITFSLEGCSNGGAGTRLKTDINLTYRDEEVIYHTRYGELIAVVE